MAHPVRPNGRRGDAILYTPTAGAIEAKLARDGRYELPRGIIVTTVPIVVPSGCELSGSPGGTTIEASGDFPAIVIGSEQAPAWAVCVCDLTITRVGGGTASDAIVQCGSAWLDDLILDGHWTGVRYVERPDGAIPQNGGQLVRVLVRHGAATAATSQFGIQLNDCTGVVLRDCDVRGSHLDALKLRRNCADTTIVGGYYGDSPQSGINLYAGGCNVIVRDAVIAGSTGGAGVTIKTGESNPALGAVSDITFDGVTVRGNASAGIAINRSLTGPDAPRPQRVTIRGGSITGNGGAGVYVDGIGVLVDGTHIRDNGGAGVRVTDTARDVRVVGVTLAANGAADAVACNAVVAGSRVTLESLTLLGRDGSIADDAAFDALPAVSAVGVLFQHQARDVVMRGWSARGHTSADAAVDASGGQPGVVVHGSGPGAPVLCGAAGSTWTRTDTGQRYVKASLAIDPTGWVLL